MVRVDFVYPLRMKGGFSCGKFGKAVHDSEGIAHRILVVWVHSFMRYFNCCPFPLNMLNCRYPFGDQLIFMSRNVIFLKHLKPVLLNR